MNPSHLSTCWLNVSFCSSETREDGKPGVRRASLSHTVSRAKQCLFRQKSTSAKWSIRLRDDWPPMAWWKNRFFFFYITQQPSCIVYLWWKVASSPPVQPAGGVYHFPARPDQQEECLRSVVLAPSAVNTNKEPIKHCTWLLFIKVYFTGGKVTQTEGQFTHSIKSSTKTIQKFGIKFFERSLFWSTRLHLFDQKYSKNSNIIIYYYNLKI